MSEDGLTDDYMEKLLEILNRLGFTTGSNVLKIQSLSLIEDLLSDETIHAKPLESLIHSLRPFTLDWDRMVRSRAFRVLRLLLDRCESIQAQLSLDVLALIRLESSKSPQERSSILRFLAKWLTISTDPRIARKIIHSLAEILLAFPGVFTCSPVDFYSTIFVMLLDSSKRFPTETLQLLTRLANTSIARLDNQSSERLLVAIIGACAATKRSVQLSPDISTRRTIAQLSKSFAGLSILHYSLTSQKVCDEAVTFLELLVSCPLDDPSLSHILRQVPDLSSTLLHSAHKTMSSYPSTTPAELELLRAVQPPGITEYMQSVNWRFPDWVSQKFADCSSLPQEPATINPSWFPLAELTAPMVPLSSQGLDHEREMILREILQLLSSVQFKTRSAKLTGKRQQNPALFQSPQLWTAVYRYMYSGSFNLQSRRVIHGLLVHAICSAEDLDAVDVFNRS